MQTAALPPVVSLRPYLDPQAFARAFPFHLHVDEHLRVIGVGASLAKILNRLVQGRPMSEVARCRRPAEARSAQDWYDHQGLCVLVTETQPPLLLRGNATALEDGSLLFVVAPVVGRMEEVADLGLGFNDFALHDPLGEVLLINRAAQMTLADANRLAERLRLKTAQLNTIMELSNNGVAYLSPLHQVDYVNTALARMVACSRADLLGRDVAELDGRLSDCMSADDVERGLLARLLDTVPLTEEPISVQLSDPVKRVLQLSVRGSPEGGCVLYFRDMTAESEIDRMKSEFLSTAAHELRTPMASVFGFSELLLKREFPVDRQREMLGTIHKQAGILINLINELLDLARIEARRGKDFKRRVQPVEPIVRQAVAALMVPGDAHEVGLAISCPDAAVLVDSEKLGQAVTNVLSNAYKYSPAGGDILVTVDMAPAGDAVAIAVRDSGIGMTAEQLSRLFERFYRADPSGNIPGTGLGMCLVKEIVELHGGSVVVDSEFGRGTRVVLNLPLALDGTL